MISDSKYVFWRGLCYRREGPDLRLVTSKIPAPPGFARMPDDPLLFGPAGERKPCHGCGGHLRIDDGSTKQE
jgi:hypothetical protein